MTVMKPRLHLDTALRNRVSGTFKGEPWKVATYLRNLLSTREALGRSEHFMGLPWVRLPLSPQNEFDSMPGVHSIYVPICLHMSSYLSYMYRNMYVICVCIYIYTCICNCVLAYFFVLCIGLVRLCSNHIYIHRHVYLHLQISVYVYSYSALLSSCMIL